MSAAPVLDKHASAEHHVDDEKDAAIVNEADVDPDVIDIVHAAEGQYTEAQYNKLLRKIDWTLLPLMWLTYGLQQADKTATSTQATFGLRKDTHLVGQQYSWLSTIFYLTYLVGEFPGNYVLHRFHVGRTLAGFMFSWGVIVLCIAFCKNFTQLAVLRALQGIAECTISPAFLIITGSWYRSNEHAHRSIIWGTANAGFGTISSLISYGVGHAAQKSGDINAAWKYISYYLGGLTILVSIPVFFILGTPREAIWLSAEEKRMAIARVLVNQTGSDREKRGHINWTHVREVFIDPQTYFLFFAVFIGSLPNGGVTTYINLVYTSFGFTSLESLLEGTLPHDVLSTIWFIFVGLVTLKRKGLRFYFMTFSLVPGFVGLLVMGLLPMDHKYLWVKWGMFLMSVTANITGLMLWTFVPSNVAGHTKRTVTQTILFAAYCSGNAVGAQIFQASDAPLYHRALTVCATMYAVEFVLLFCWRFYYVWQNNRRDKLVAAMGLTKEESEHQGRILAEDDVSDWSNVHFRYTT
ncbi:hypothetical protein CI109_101360 [Kwoniella shandongensis]|uniref:Uncharacterized protein n=1 Tax=Kwoniella shandongensis TaxID=1734106 RepID=A0A5M6BTX0_9TREE|nr:uncharacterized protein CI109_005262 [Kwoniella shandongensis]KAA5526306.1 hypothetical protein CI109_005262 [Kwoniella shandongensis]